MKSTIKKILMSYIPFACKKYLFKCKLYLREPKLLLLANSKYRTNAPTLLLLSFPRSGSSWVGSILGTGEHVRYLREPVTTSYTLQKKHRISVFDKTTCDNWNEYQSYIDKSLHGSANFSSSIIKFTKQWLKPHLKKTLVIKEVNPLVIDNYLSKPIKLVYLVRHPFSVAKSYSALNWQPTEVFSNKFNKATLNTLQQITPNLLQQSFWFQMGYLQGWVEATVKREISVAPKKNKAIILVRYEDICREAESEFIKLFSFANLPFTEKVSSAITNSLKRKEKVSAGDFSLTRSKEDIETIKVNTNEQENYHELMLAYHQAILDFCQHQSPTIKNITPSFTLNSSLVKLLK
ncbi:sulfotransferase domain-containing protein [Colwellia sp. D2M02]|uniref:sulfotransferase domain-containing protein n=1 Tax=Colwellia sp. D2M02 TaxID=2841562 RepID=UPI001C087BE2|nr:sulfotransferase domain-containing protein [Colwellia sp. D2M02]MBU2891926.1 sulfotransferase domain-containing protein [Colwellia sp. D2M02]